MTHVLVTDTGTVDSRPGAPSVDELIALTGDGVPEMVRTTHPNLVAWVNDDWIARVERGEWHRNIPASMIYLVTGGPLTPLGGPVVFTGLREEDGQLLPAELPADVQAAVEGVSTDVALMLEGRVAEASFRDDPEADPERIVAELQAAKADLEAAPLVPLAGGYSLADAEKAALDQLRAQGMPEFVVEMIAEANNVTYTPPSV
jgi:hypothetical protein